MKLFNDISGICNQSISLILKMVNFRKNLRMRYTVITFILCCIMGSVNSFAQDSNKMVDTSGFKVRLYSSAFFDNKEFTSDIKKGYTYPGFFIQPRVEYKPSSKTSISAGIHALYFAGSDSLDLFVPVLTFQYSITDKIKFLLGTIDSKELHFLPEPLFKPERLFTSHPETGVQFLSQTDRFKGDLWINWERYIKEKSPFQEVFTIGISGIYSLNTFGKSSGFYFPFHALATHRGGQINSGNNIVTTLANYGGGAGYTLFLNDGNISLGVESLFLFFKDISPNPHYVFKSGNAIYPRFYIKGSSFKAEVGYWKASSFVNPRGEELFGSVSVVDSTFNQKNRELITSKFIYSKEVAKGFTVEFRFDLYVDPKPSIFDYSYTFRMVFDDRLFFRR